MVLVFRDDVQTQFCFRFCLSWKCSEKHKLLLSLFASVSVFKLFGMIHLFNVTLWAAGTDRSDVYNNESSVYKDRL